jgi:hypothetical protein
LTALATSTFVLDCCRGILLDLSLLSIVSRSHQTHLHPYWEVFAFVLGFPVRLVALHGGGAEVVENPQLGPTDYRLDKSYKQKPKDKNYRLPLSSKKKSPFHRSGVTVSP